MPSRSHYDWETGFTFRRKQHSFMSRRIDYVRETRSSDVDGVFEVGGLGVRILDFLDVRDDAFHDLLLDERVRCHLNLLRR